MTRASLLLGAVALGAPLAVAGAAGPRPVVHIRGTAYEFNNVHVMLGGATIRVAESPKLHATVRADGTYDLVVPDRARVTPFITAAGHHTIYLQTFTTAGENLDNANFQTPSDGVYRALAALLNVPLNAAGNPAQCAIVSTFSTKNVRDLSFAGFIAYGAHGVAGATASARPALPRPTYFSQNVIPDPAQPASSKDGGVIWTRVPSGPYVVAGHSPSTRFARFTASCRPGRIINANPPWGLHELAGPNPARVSASFRERGGRTRVISLIVRGLPPGSVIRVRCSGPRCPFTRAGIFHTTASTIDVAGRLGLPLGGLRAAQTIELAVTSHAYNGEVTRWAIQAARTPRVTRLCVPLGETKPQRVCSS